MTVIESAINEVCSNFDFDKVHKAMLLLDWQWLKSDGSCQVPNQDDLKKCAERLLRLVAKLVASKVSDPSVCCGGLMAEAIGYDEASGTAKGYRLSFELAHAIAEFD